MQRDISSLQTLGAFVQELTKAFTTPMRGATVLGLVGDLGAGKTTFTQLLARELGVTEVVTSPTFLVMRSYETTHPVFTRLIHIDAYRIENLADLAPLRFQEIIADPNALVVVEWADRIKAALPLDSRYFTFVLQPDGTRTITTDEGY